MESKKENEKKELTEQEKKVIEVYYDIIYIGRKKEKKRTKKERKRRKKETKRRQKSQFQ